MLCSSSCTLERTFIVKRVTRKYPGAAIGAGAIGGFIAAFFKLGWEVPFPPRALDRIPEPSVLITMVTHTPTTAIESWIVHFTFSILSGVAYGALVEFFPIVAIGMGVGFGVAVWVGAHLIVMPWMGLTPPTAKLPISEDLSEFFGHAVWGFVIEVFRHDFRRRFVKAGHPAMPDAELDEQPWHTTKAA
jgi:putative membrane protein